MWRSYRLSRTEIESVIKKGKNVNFPSFSVKYLDFSSDDKPKVAFVASKKVFKTASERNKAKRRAKEAFRKVILEAKPNFIVFFLKKIILKTPFLLLKNEFSKVVKNDW